jgi:DNA-binding NarL/FixJ family response regulator
MTALHPITVFPDATRVLLADQPGFSRDALAVLVATTPGMELAGVVADPRQLREALARLAPDVLIIDDRLLQDLDWLPGGPRLRVIVVGVDDDPGYALRASRLGAITWLPKERADLLEQALLASREAVADYGRAPRLIADDVRGRRP